MTAYTKLGTTLLVALSFLSLTYPQVANATKVEEAYQNIKNCIAQPDHRTVNGPGAGRACCSISLKICVICPTDPNTYCTTTTYRGGKLPQFERRINIPKVKAN